MTDDYEKALLGAVLRGYRDVPTVARIVKEGDFANPIHGGIWNAAIAVHSAGSEPNFLTVRDQLGQAANKLPGGPVYLTDLDAPSVMQAEFYANKVREASIKRQIAAAGARFQQIVTDDDMRPDDMLAKARAWIEGLDQHSVTDIVDISTALEEVIDVAEKGEPAATPTPWPELTEMLGGWYPGQLIIIGARPGVGKSIALENIATDVARNHKRRVLFVSLEMTAKEITQRTMAHTAVVPLPKIRSGQDALSEREWESIQTASGVIAGTPIKFAENPHQTLNDIRAAAWEANQAAIRSGEQLGMVVIDYLQLIAARDQRISRQQQVGEMSRGLKRLARELGVPVLAAAQLNRANQSRQGGLPVLSDLREAGDIEQDADVVIFLHEEFEDAGGRLLPTGDVQLIVAKQRNGPQGTRVVRKYGHYCRFASK